MSAVQTLQVGLAVIFLALLSATSAAVLVGQQRRQVLRSLEALQGARFTAHDSAAQRGFGGRVLGPGMVRLAGVGRRLTPAGAVEALGRKMDLAGNPSRWDVERLLALKVIGLAAGVLLPLAVLPGALLVLAAPLAGALGYYLPDLLLTNFGQKRQLLIQRGLPDALDLLTISVEAGLGFDAALSQVARNTEGPLTAEFVRVLQEMQIGKSRAEALRGMGERSTVEELVRFTAAIVQADGLGIPIGNVLREQAAEMRLKRSQRAEEQAHKVPVKILFPMIVFLLPAIFVIIIGPGALTILRTIG